MEIKLTFQKDLIGRVNVILTVTDMEDYPSSSIFPINQQGPIPTDDEYELGLGKSDTLISPYFKTSKEAEKWANAQIRAIEEHLNKWREIIIPTDRYVSI